MTKKLGALALCFILSLFAVVLLVVSCDIDVGPREAPEAINARTAGNVEYTLFYVEGMPCLWVERMTQENLTFNYYSYAGLTCDWSQWKGKEQ